MTYIDPRSVLRVSGEFSLRLPHGLPPGAGDLHQLEDRLRAAVASVAGDGDLGVGLEELRITDAEEVVSGEDGETLERWAHVVHETRIRIPE